jgi:cation diffusion facilitator family transporter
MQNPVRYQQAKRVTLIGVYTNFILGVIKVIAGIFGYSQALVADGIHSFSDVMTDVMVLFAVRAGSQGPDEDHPYGHARIETMASMALAIVLVVVGLLIAWEAIRHIFYGIVSPLPSTVVIVVAVISIVANESLYRYTLRVGRRINSQLLTVNAWHNRLDVWSSFVVLIGVIGAKFGYLWLDRLAAVVVAILIIKMGVAMAWQSVKELIDTGVDTDKAEQILASIRQVPGVQAVHELRTRSLAGNVMTDVHVQVGSYLTVSEGHYIADKVYQVLVKGGFDISDVLVHIDAEDDHGDNPSQQLPTRPVLEKVLTAHWQDLPGYAEHLKINLHYLGGKIVAELFLPLSVLADNPDTKNLQQVYQGALKSIDYVDRVVVCYC